MPTRQIFPSLADQHVALLAQQLQLPLQLNPLLCLRDQADEQLGIPRGDDGRCEDLLSRHVTDGKYDQPIAVLQVREDVFNAPLRRLFECGRKHVRLGRSAVAKSLPDCWRRTLLTRPQLDLDPERFTQHGVHSRACLVRQVGLGVLCGYRGHATYAGRGLRYNPPNRHASAARGAQSWCGPDESLGRCPRQSSVQRPIRSPKSVGRLRVAALVLPAPTLHAAYAS